MKCPEWYRARMEKRGKIGVVARMLWGDTAHWCPDMDDLLILDPEDCLDNCFCWVRERYVRLRLPVGWKDPRDNEDQRQFTIGI